MMISARWLAGAGFEVPKKELDSVQLARPMSGSGQIWSNEEDNVSNFDLNPVK